MSEPITLTDDQARIIAEAGQTAAYRKAPVPAELRSEFNNDLFSFSFIPIASLRRLRRLFPDEPSIEALIAANWREAFDIGALKSPRFDNSRINFPLSVDFEDDQPFEAGLQRNNKSNDGDENWRPWCITYISEADDDTETPQESLMATPFSVLKDFHVQSDDEPASDVTSTVQPTEADADIAEAAVGDAAVSTPAELTVPGFAMPDLDGEQEIETAELPDLNIDAMKAIRDTRDYLNSPVPDELRAEIDAQTDPLSSWVHVPLNRAELICTFAGGQIDVNALLDRDWEQAKQLGALREFDGKVIFPISIMREDGATPIEIHLRRVDHPLVGDGSEKIKPWFLSYVDDFIRQRANAGTALTDWAYMGQWRNTLKLLADLALPERWDFMEDDGEEPTEHRYFILQNYLTYTFARLQAEGKVLENREMGIAAFNTGLVDRTYAAIYACFKPQAGRQQWRFSCFCHDGDHGMGKMLVRAFDPLPVRARYIRRTEDLLLNTERNIALDNDHILIDNLSRLPLAFLKEEFRGADGIEEPLETLETEAPDSQKCQKAYESLRKILKDTPLIKRRFINRLKDAVELARKRVDWNYRTAVPAYYPRHAIMSLLLPLDLTEEGTPDIALVIELTESGAYLGQTILTLQMAYCSARLVCRPDSDWLNTTTNMLMEAARTGLPTGE